MPVHFGHQDAGENLPPERLPGDSGGDLDWVCPKCEGAQHGRPEHGCQLCGSGKPGTKATTPQPTLEELQGQKAHAPQPMNVAGLADQQPRPTGLAERILGQKQGNIQLDEIRTVVREELRALISPAAMFSGKERAALLEGLKVIQHYASQNGFDEEMQAQLPDAEGLAALAGRIQEG